jgi:hypothetical protein
MEVFGLLYHQLENRSRNRKWGKATLRVAGQGEAASGVQPGKEKCNCRGGGGRRPSPDFSTRIRYKNKFGHLGISNFLLFSETFF